MSSQNIRAHSSICRADNTLGLLGRPAPQVRTIPVRTNFRKGQSGLLTRAGRTARETGRLATLADPNASNSPAGAEAERTSQRRLKPVGRGKDASAVNPGVVILHHRLSLARMVTAHLDRPRACLYLEQIWLLDCFLRALCVPLTDIGRLEGATGCTALFGPTRSKLCHRFPHLHQPPTSCHGTRVMLRDEHWSGVDRRSAAGSAVGPTCRAQRCFCGISGQRHGAVLLVSISGRSRGQA